MDNLINIYWMLQFETKEQAAAAYETLSSCRIENDGDFWLCLDADPNGNNGVNLGCDSIDNSEIVFPGKPYLHAEEDEDNDFYLYLVGEINVPEAEFRRRLLHMLESVGATPVNIDTEV